MQLLATLQLTEEPQNTENMKIIWMNEPKRAEAYRKLYKKSYLCFKQKIVQELGLAKEHSTQEKDMFHSYDMYLEGETIFVYDTITYNRAM